ncbi:thiosulfate sulfurtransferase [Dysgonomonas alginatilytica]|uniref:Thiosulfate sulfurtransferase n=1 Tax=Dysgonomonas alginatilytica TaxID=1605892 RepID=A0A2V3PNK0_9BACT|nr:thiosulfate sulfurtransferase GlpE [Dysgonomonas alginatilytica]PXV64088.1 thiosulfate sulfurtransferase [Dysgonomonas alginatilytica]
MFQRISKEVAKKMLATEKKAILIDMRDSQSYDEGHDENALHLTQENLSDFIVGTEKQIPVLVMCYHGNSSQSLAQYLTAQGFEAVYSIDGGYEEWKDE